MRVDWCVSSWFRIKNTHSLTPSLTVVHLSTYIHASYSARAGQGAAAAEQEAEAARLGNAQAKELETEAEAGECGRAERHIPRG